jgi:hypothetical protein
MRALSAAMVAALSLGGCAPPLAFVDFAAQIRRDFGLGQQSCAGPFSTAQNHTAQANCFHESPVAQSKPSVLTETHTKQRLVNLSAGGRASPPKLDGAYKTAGVAAEIPTLNFEASCHLADNLAVDQNANYCLAVEGRARDQLAHRWAEFPSEDRSQCARYTSAGGGGTYTDLLTCLESKLFVRNLHEKNRSVATH